MSDISTKQYLYGADTLQDANIVSGGLLMAGFNENDEVVGGGTATNTIVDSGVGTDVVISAQGTAESRTVLSGLTMNAGSAVLSGGVDVTDFSISGAKLFARAETSGAKATFTNVVVGNGATLTVNSSGTVGADDGTQINNVTVEKGGKVYAYRTDITGGTINSGTLSGWHAHLTNVVVNGGLLYNMGGSGTMSNVTLNTGTVNLRSGWIKDFTINDGSFDMGGTAALKVGGLVLNNGVASFKGNYLSTKNSSSFWVYNNYADLTVNGGTLNIYGGNFGSATFGKVVVSGGLNVNGGTVNFMTLTPEEATVSSGAFLNCDINVTGGTIILDNAENAAWVNDAKATWNFDLSNRTAEDSAFLNDFSFSNATGYSVTVKADQAVGTYQLAGNAGNLMDREFAFTIGTEAQNNLTVGGSTVTVGDYNYTLKLTDNALALSVETAETGAITITADSVTVAYNGQEQSVTTYTWSGKLNAGDDFYSVAVSGSSKDVAVVDTVVGDVVIHDANGNDVTSTYTINKINGTLEVTKRSVTIKSGDATKPYDGKPLTCDTITVSGDGFVDGEATASATGSQTEVGASPNTITLNTTPEYKEGNYDITREYGTLTVTQFEEYPDIIGSSVNVATSGATYSKYGAEGKGFVIGEGGTLNNGYYVAGESIYTAGTVTSATISSGGVLSIVNVSAGATVLKDVILDGGILRADRKISGTTVVDGSAFYIDGLDIKDGSIPIIWSGYVKNLTQSAGKFVASNCTISGAVLSGGTLNTQGTKVVLYNITVDGGTLNVIGGKTFNGITVRNGLLNVTNPSATFNNLVVSGGSATVAGVGATGAKVYGGSMDVIRGTYAGLTVSGGTLTFGSGAVTSGATVTGDFTIGGSAQVKVLDGFPVDDTAASWIFDLTDRTGSESVMVEDFSKFTGTAITINVATAQTDGTYLIAGGASALADRTLSLNVITPMDITVNGAAVETDFGTYTLALDEGNNLALTVVAKEVPPVLLYKDSQLVASGASFDGITLGGADYDAVSILSGGTVTNLEYVSGAISVQEGGILNGVTVSSGASIVVDYTVSNLNADAATAGAVVLASGAVVNGGTILCAISGAKIQAGAVANDLVVSTVHSNGCYIAGTANNLTISGSGLRLDPTGVVSGATVLQGALKLFNGTVTGNVDVASGAQLEFGYTTGKISSATVNLSNGAALYATHSTCSGAAHPVITSDSIVNVSAGARFVNRTELDVNGVINLKGGVLDNSTTTSGHAGMTLGSAAKLNVYAVADYASAGNAAVSSYANLTDNGCTISVMVDGNPTVGDYYLMGEAAAFADDRNITLSVSGSEEKTLSIAGGKVKVAGYEYLLSKDDSSNLLLTVTEATTIDLTITADSYSEKYNGQTFTASYKITSGALLEGDTIEVTVTGSITDVGTETSTITSYKIMRGETEVTGKYNVTTVDGSLEVLKRTVTIVSNSDSKKYDGSALTGTITVSGDGFVAGEAEVSAGTTIIDAGTVTNTITITEGAGYKESNYDITKTEGTLDVLKRSVTIEGKDASKVYDGTALVGEVTVSGDGFVAGEAEVSAGTTIIDAGTATNTITITEGTGYKAGNYDITTTEGTLTIDKRAITLKSGDNAVTAGGTAYNDVVTDTLDSDPSVSGFVTGEGATYTNFSSRTEVGSSTNTFDYALNDGTKADNYVIKQEFGSLIVTGSGTYSDIIGSAVTISGGEQYGAPYDGFKIASDDSGNKGILNVGYVDGETIYGGGTVYSATVGAGGTMKIVSGADMSLNDITLDGGVLSCPRQISGTASGGTFIISGLTVNDGGYMSTWKAYVKDFTQNGGSVTFWSGGVSNGTVSGGTLAAMGGAVIFDNTDIFGGTVKISSGRATNDTIYDGTVIFENKSVAAANWVISGGTVTFNGTSNAISGATISGGDVTIKNATICNTITVGGAAQITVADAATVTDSAATWVFDLTNRDASADAIISDFSFTNASGYTISASAEQAFGSYKLAGITTFDRSVTLIVGGETQETQLTVGGGTVKVGKTNYELKLADNVLSVTVESAVAGELTITAGSYTGTYDGQAHELTYSVTGKMLQEGDVLTVTQAYDSVTDAGTMENTITTYKVMRGESDVTGEYIITTAAGSIDVAKRSITIRSGDASKEYDGNPLTCEVVEVTSGAFVEGEGATYGNFASLTEIGTTSNTFDYALSANTKESNYDITKEYGTLTVTSGVSYPDIIGSSVNVATSGATYSKYGAEGKGFVIAADENGTPGVLNNGFVDGSTIYAAGPVTSATVASGGTINIVNTAAGKPIILKDVTVESGGVIDDGERKPDGTTECAVYTISGLTINGGTVGAGVSGYLHRVNISDFSLNAGSFKGWSCCLTSGTINDGYLSINGNGNYLSAATMNGGTVTGGASFKALGLNMVGGVLNIGTNGQHLSNSVISGGTAVLAGNYYSAKTTKFTNNIYKDNVIYGGDVTIQGGHVNGLTISGGAVKFTTKDNSTETTASSGTYLSGNVTLGGAAQVEVKAYTSGAEVNYGWFDDTAASYIFDLTDRDASAEAIINDFNFTNAASYTVSVKAGQADGSYKLAGISEFTKEVSLSIGGEVQTQKLTVGGGAVKIGSCSYELTLTDNVLTVTVDSAAGALTITAGSYTGEKYDGQAHKLEYSVTGKMLQAGDVLTVTQTFDSVTDACEETANAITSYTVMRGETDVTAEYTITTVAGSIDVAKRTVTIESKDASKVYDGTALVGEVTVSGDGFVDGEATVSGGTIVDAGTATNTITINEGTGYKADNYDITTTEGTLTIDKRAITIKSGDSTVVLGGTAYNDVVTDTLDSDPTVSGFVEGQGAIYTGFTSRTESGSQTNTFDYALSSGTNENNYVISKVEGTLSVVEEISFPVMLSKGGEFVSGGTSFDGITLGGADYDAVTILSGGTVTNLTYSGGAIQVSGGLLSGMTVAEGVTAFNVDYEVSDLDTTNIASGSVRFLSGAVVHGGTLYTDHTYGVNVSNGAVLSNITFSGEMSNGLCVLAGGVIYGLTIPGQGSAKGASTPTRISGTVIGADISGAVSLKTFDNGVVGGVINMNSGATLNMAYTATKVSGGTVNLNSGAQMLAAHTSCSAEAHPVITEDSIVNVSAGAWISDSTELEVNGTINLMGGNLKNSSVTSGHTGVTLGSAAKMNVYAVSDYVAEAAVTSYGNLVDNGFAITVVVDTPAEAAYKLMGDAANFGTKREISLSVGGEVQTQKLTLAGEAITVGSYRYKLENVSDVLTLNVVEIRDVTITAGSYSGQYDGTAHTAGYEITSGELKAGDELSVTVDGSVTNVEDGTVISTITSCKVMRGETDVTDEYKLTTETGTLEVTKRAITIKSGDATKEYDGDPLVCKDVTVTDTGLTSGGFAAGEGATYSNFASQTEIGTTSNTFDYALSANTKESNYDITKEYGTLEVTSAVQPYPDIIGSSVNVAAPESYGNAKGFVIADGGTLNNGYVDGETIYTGGTVIGGTVRSGGLLTVANTAAGAPVLFKDLVIDGGTFSGPRAISGTTSGALFRVDGLTVNSGAFGYVWRCGVDNFAVNDGTVIIHSGYLSSGTVNGGLISGYGGGFTLKDAAISGGTVKLTGNGINVSMYGGTLNVTVGGMRLSSSIISGGTAVLAGNYYSAKTSAWTKNTYNNNTVYGGGVTIQGGLVNGLTVSGGTVTFITNDNSTEKTVSSGAYLSGAITLGGAAQVNVTAATSGGTVNYGWIDDSAASYVFDLSERNAASGVFIDGFDFTNATGYTVSVTADQAIGDYKLAGIAAFDKTVSLVVDGVTKGDLTVGGTPITGENNYEYSLKLSDSVLSLEVAIPGQLAITVDSYSGMYDGQAHTVEYHTSGKMLQTDDVLTVTVTGNTATDAGTYTTTTSYKVMRGTTDVTSLYTFTVTEGTLDIAKRAITIKSGDATKEYDGEPLTCETVDVISGGFVAGEGATYSNFASQTEIGTTSNTFDYALSANTKESNYDITQEYGTLTVVPYQKYRNIVNSTVNLTAPAIYGEENEGFYVGEGGTLNNGYVEESTIYTAGTVTSATISSGGVINVVNSVKGGTIFKDLVIDGGFLSAVRKADGTTDGALFCVDGLTVRNGGISYAWRCQVNGLLQSGGSLSFHSGGVSGGTILDGYLKTSGNGAMLRELVVSGGTVAVTNGYIRDSEIQGGLLSLTGGSGSIDLTVNGGTAKLANAASVHSGLKVFGGTVELAGILSGGITIGGTAQITVADAAKVTEAAVQYVFDLTNTPAGNAAFISDFSFTNADSYSISVKADQAYGTYTLAGNASALVGKSFTLNVGESDYSLLVGSKIVVNDIVYELGVAKNQELALTVRASESGELIITAGTYSGVYDGQAHELTYSVTGKMIQEDDVLTVTQTYESVTDAGTMENSIFSYKVMRGGVDVTKQYIITTETGSVDVARRSITLKSADAMQQYDGTALTCKVVDVLGDGFVEGEGATYSVTGVQTEIGSSPNSFTYTLNEGTKESNYDITKVEGTLTVYEKRADVIGETVNLAAPDTYGNAKGFVIASNAQGVAGVLNNGYVDGESIFTGGTVIGAIVKTGGVLAVANTATGEPVLFRDIVIEGGKFSGPRAISGKTSGALFRVEGLTVNGGNFGYVWRCGVTGFTINRGSATIHSGYLSSGTINGGIVSGYGTGFTFQDVTISGGTVVMGGLASNVSMLGGTLTIGVGGMTLSGSFISGGTTVLAGNYYSGKASRWVENTYNDNVICGGNVTIHGGHVTNLTVSGGTVTFVTADNSTESRVSSGAYLSGAIELAGSAQVKLDGAYYDWIDDSEADYVFNLSGRTGKEDVFVNDFNFSDAKSYTITANANQAYGSYKLVGVSDFDRSISLSVNGEVKGELTVGGDVVTAGKCDYRLTLTDEQVLTLSVTEAPWPVTIKKDGKIVSETEDPVSGATIGTSQAWTEIILNRNGIATSTTVLDGGTLTMSAGTAFGVQVSSGGVVDVLSGNAYDVEIFGGSDGFRLASGGTATNVTFNDGAFARISGTLNGGTIRDGEVRLFDRGVLGGTTDVYGGGVVVALSRCKIDGTVNLLGNGTYLKFNDVEATLDTEITSGGTINVNSGSWIGTVNGGVTNLTINGTISLAGGRLLNGKVLLGHKWVWGDSGILDFQLTGADFTDEPYVVSYNKLNVPKTITLNSDGSTGEYVLFGDAKDVSLTILVSVGDCGTREELAMNGTVVIGSSVLSLSLNEKNEVVLKVTAARVDQTGTISVNPVTGIAAAAWDTETEYTAGDVFVGNAGTSNTALYIKNAGDGAEAPGANTRVFGGVSGASMSGAAQLELYQGDIGALIGGAQSADCSVGAVGIRIGGGTTSAVTGEVCGGGYGSVDDGVKIITSSNAVVNGAVCGGPQISGYAGNNVTIGGDVEVILKGGRVADNVIGGAKVCADTVHTTTIGGTASVDVCSSVGIGGNVYGAGRAEGLFNAERAEGADYTVNAVAISMTADGQNIYGGAVASGYAKAQVAGDVSIDVAGGSVDRIYGGGWAESGAESLVGGDVSIDVSNATVGSIYGGGAHLIGTAVSGITNVSGSVSVTVADCSVDTICAVGMSDGDLVAGTAVVNLSGKTNAGSVYGCRLDGSDGNGAAETTLALEDFTGCIAKDLKGFNSVVISNNTMATFASDADISGTNWTFDLTNRYLSTGQAALTWEDGDGFDGASFSFDLGTKAKAWTVCDLSGDDVKADAFSSVKFDLTIGDKEITNYQLGTDINVGAWDNWKLDYDKESGVLAFAKLA